LQNQIAQTVHNRVSGSTPGQVALDSDNHPSVEAYQLLLEAKRNLEGSSLETTDEAIRLLRLAIELSPQYAEAHVLLSEALSAKSVGLNSRGKPWNRSLFDEAKRETELALQLDHNNARALWHGEFSQAGGAAKNINKHCRCAGSSAE
jgi:tetratricopeptide (TPR) repeat protein